MEKLRIESKEIENIFISHSHRDHTGGLSSFLKLNSQVRVWVPSYIPAAENAREVIEVKSPRKLYEGVYSTGELDGIEQSFVLRLRKVYCNHGWLLPSKNGAYS